VNEKNNLTFLLKTVKYIIRHSNITVVKKKTNISTVIK